MTSQTPDLFNVWLRGIDGAPDEPHMSFPKDQREEAEFEILDLKDHDTKAYFGPSFPAKNESQPYTVNVLRKEGGVVETQTETFEHKGEALALARKEVKWENTIHATVTHEPTGEDIYDREGDFI
jgi:hypothetical protein